MRHIRHPWHTFLLIYNTKQNKMSTKSDVRSRFAQIKCTSNYITFGVSFFFCPSFRSVFFLVAFMDTHAWPISSHWRGRSLYCAGNDTAGQNCSLLWGCYGNTNEPGMERHAVDIPCNNVPAKKGHGDLLWTTPYPWDTALWIEFQQVILNNEVLWAKPHWTPCIPSGFVKIRLVVS